MLARLCCLDLDTFFVSVERILDPSLVGKPVVVGGRPGSRGVVTAASYEVRERGVRSGMPLSRAVALAPHAIFLPTRHDTYGGYSQKVWKIVEKYCPTIQVASIDELYMDFRGCERLYRRSEDVDDDRTIERVVRELTATIQSELGLPASVGIARSKIVAKIASGLAKPAGVLFVPEGNEAQLLSPLPVRKYPGIGPAAEERLAAAGIVTLGQILTASEAKLKMIFGSRVASIQRGIRGESEGKIDAAAPAFRERDVEVTGVGSISNERTFREDVDDPQSIDAMLCSLAERVCWRARARGLKARTISLKFRYGDFQTCSRSRTLEPTDSESVVLDVVRSLLADSWTRTRPLRLVGVGISKFDANRQIDLFSDTTEFHRAVDSVRDRFGFESLRLASTAETGKKYSTSVPPDRENEDGPAPRENTKTRADRPGRRPRGPGSKRRDAR